MCKCPLSVLRSNEEGGWEKFPNIFKANKKTAVTIRADGANTGPSCGAYMRQPDETIATLAPQQIFK